MSKKLTTEEFIKKSIDVHGDIYGYSKSIYKTGKEQIEIECKEHGYFWQSASNHMSGKGCIICNGGSLKNTNEFIKSIKNLDDNLSLEKVIYKGFKDQIEIICSRHGSFFKQAVSFKKNPTCSKCNVENSFFDSNYYISILNNKHEFKYTYPDFEYKGSHKKINIECKEHGIFEQTYHNHSYGQGCPKCQNKHMDKNLFIELSKDKNPILNINYSKVIYKNARNNIELICPIHGSFLITPDNHLRKNQGCQKCAKSRVGSSYEKELFEFISSFIYCEKSNRSILDGFEIDIYIPELNLGIEFNGLYWHSDNFLEDNYHLKKLELADSKGIQLVQIFEDEWVNKKEIVKSRLLNIIKGSNKIYARKTRIQEVPTSEAMIFLGENHIQGRVGAKLKLGLYFNDELVSLMTFGNLRKNLGQTSKEGSYELLRFCNKLNTSVVGGASKLFKYFVKNYSPEKVISYADRRWSKGNLYFNLGFDFVSNSRPNYFYIKGQKLEQRFKYRKNILIEQGFDKNKTEREIMKERKFHRIYDCGAMKFEWKKEV